MNGRHILGNCFYFKNIGLNFEDFSRFSGTNVGHAGNVPNMFC
jgi:hypothetical protein